MKTAIKILAILMGMAVATIPSPAAGNGDPDSLQSRRNLIVCYEIKHYDSRIRDTVYTLFHDLIRRGDNLIVYSPARVYGFSQKTLSRPKAQLIAWLQDRLKTDCNVASSGYRQVFTELKGLVEEMIQGQTDSRSVLSRYRQGLDSLNSQRRINQPLLLKFARMFAQTPGNNHVVVFFEKELRPVPDSNLMDSLMQNVNLAFSAREVFMDPSEQVDPKKIQAVIDAFHTASATLHFAYLKPGRERAPRRMELFEHSADMYGFFSRVAQETGGINLTTANAGEMMKAILARLEK